MPMAIRMECSSPGLEGNWLEVSEVWSRRELRDLVTVKGEPFVALWERKVTACNLVTVAGAVITDPRQVYGPDGCRDDLDLRLDSFLTSAVLDATGYLLTLGEVSKRLLYAGVEVAATTQTKETTPTPAAQPTAIS